MSTIKNLFNTKNSLKTLIYKVFRRTKTLEDKRQKLIENHISEEDTWLKKEKEEKKEKKEKESISYLKTQKQLNHYDTEKNKIKNQKSKTDIKPPRIKKAQESNYLYY